MKSVIIKISCLLISAFMILACAGCGAEHQEESLLKEDAALLGSYYRLGDKMGDYTVTDVNGVEYKFSDILKEKKAIVLNFWFLNCNPCRIEFPYLNEAYENYKDDIEVLALNTVGESEADIKAFAAESGLSFPIAVGDTAWNQALAIQGFPTTVVIDRTGVVSMIHVGYLDSVEPFNKVFEFFTKEDYTPTLVENINDIN